MDRCLRIGAIEDVAAIFVAHSHYDHLLDVGYLAEKTKAKVYGSLSTRAVLRGQYENFKKVAHGQVEEIGHAQVRIFETAHSVPALYKGAITRPIAGRQRASRYRLGKNYSFFISYGHDPRFAALVVPSAGKVGETFRGLKANTVFLSIGMLGWRPSKEIEAYWNATVREVRAKNVYLIHWDDFRIPLTEPLRKMPFPPDRIDTALRTIKRLGERDRINVRLPRAFEEFILK